MVLGTGSITFLGEAESRVRTATPGLGGVGDQVSIGFRLQIGGSCLSASDFDLRIKEVRAFGFLIIGFKFPRRRGVFEAIDDGYDCPERHV